MHRFVVKYRKMCASWDEGKTIHVAALWVSIECPKLVLLPWSPCNSFGCVTLESSNAYDRAVGRSVKMNKTVKGEIILTEHY